MQASNGQPTLDTETVKRLALDAHVDERSIRKVLSGGTVRGQAGERIKRALASLSLIIAPTGAQEPST
jgi:hypothetical protein